MQQGAGRAHNFALSIRLLSEQRVNEFIEGNSKLVTLNYFFTRKLSFVKEAHAFALLPGGFGTMDAAGEIAQFYKVFHSARSVGERFVIRLNRSLSNEALVDLNNHFTDILRTGEIVQRVALPKESDELETLDLPWLVFTPIRSRFGRFRQLIDAINCFPTM